MLSSLTQLFQPVLNTRHEPDQTLLQFFQYLPSVVVGAGTDRFRFALGLCQQPCLFGFNGRHESLFLQHLLHTIMRLAKQSVLFADHPPCLLEFFRHRHSHLIDDVEHALFIDKQPPTKWNAPPFCKNLFKFVNELVELDGSSPPHIGCRPEPGRAATPTLRPGDGCIHAAMPAQHAAEPTSLHLRRVMQAREPCSN